MGAANLSYRRRSRSKPPPSGSKTIVRNYHSLKRWLPFLIIIIAGIGAFGSSLNGKFMWDDEYVILNNLFIRDLKNLPDLFTSEYFAPSDIGHYTQSGEESYRPVVTLTHFIDYALFKLNPVGYHAGNLLFHLATAIALYLLLMNLSLPVPAALPGALLFAVHPVNSETVNMISYREDLLAGMFLCLALAGFLRKRPFMTGLFGILALFSKEMAFTMLPLAALFLILNRSVWRQYIPALSVIVLITIGYSTAIFGGFAGSSLAPSEYPGGSFGSAMATSARVVMHYLQLFVWPSHLAVDMHFLPSESFFDIRALGGILLLTGIISFTSLWRCSWQLRYLILWFFIALIPVSGVYPIKNFVAERYMYIPVMGLCGVAGIGFSWLYRHGSGVRNAALGGLVVVVFAGMFANNLRNAIWWEETRFFQEMVRANPFSYKGHTGLALASHRRGDLESAIFHLKQAVTIRPDNVIALYNLGCMMLEKKELDDAISCYRSVLILDPGFTESHYQLGLALLEKGNADEAEQSFRKALEYNPNFIPAQFMFGVVLQNRGEYQEAASVYQRILNRDGTYAKAHKNLGLIYLNNLDRPADAAEHLDRYLKLVPNDPQAELIRSVIRNIR
ncbi:tetratricopeptide repeat protein [bacterium]|nr:tetratricopeptide repeat protein [candidate division CSSED10-310 bacterium]